MPASLYVSDEPVHSVYRLAGRKEDALTYALGYLLAHDRRLCLEFLKESKVLPRVRGKSYEALLASYAVYLQQRDNVGRRDLVVEAQLTTQLRVVVEAKIGGGQPSADQLLKYTVGTDAKEREAARRAWQKFERRAIVSLTRDVLDGKTRDEVRRRLDSEHQAHLSGIALCELQWHQIYDLVSRRRNGSANDPVGTFLLNEFARFFTEDYDMRYYDAEVFIKDVDAENERIFEEGHVYVGGGYVSPLYFAPYFTAACAKPGLYRIARVLYVEEVQGWAVDLHDRLSARFEERLSPEDFRTLWKPYWSQGVRLVLERVRRERANGRRWGPASLYFLDTPLTLLQEPLIKPKGFKQIGRKFSRTLADLVGRKPLGAARCGGQESHPNLTG